MGTDIYAAAGISRKEYIELVRDRRLCTILDKRSGRYLHGTEILIWGDLEGAIFFGPDAAFAMIGKARRDRPEAVIAVPHPKH